MPHSNRRATSFSDRGQSMVETALILPILLLLAFNAINFGYFIFAAVKVRGCHGGPGRAIALYWHENGSD